MADSTKSPEDLIEEVISFIKKERELYGDFSLDYSSKPGNPDPAPPSSADKTEEVSDIREKQSDQKTEQPMARSPQSDSFDAQEGFFNQDESKEVYYKIDKCDSLKELEELCAEADVLRTDLEGTQLVFGVGNPDADLMLIGEAPGAEEDKQGEPFVGRAGKLLDKILDAIDLSREDVYIANILKHRPPNNRDPKPEERERSLPFLLRQIDLVNPKLILTLGKVAAQTLLDSNESLKSMRGEFHDFRGKYKLLATYHPAALLRNPNWKRPTWEDMQLLRNRYDELNCSP